MWSLPISRCLEEREIVFVHPVEYVTETKCSKKFSFFHTMEHITEVALRYCFDPQMTSFQMMPIAARWSENLLRYGENIPDFL
jgi:hypothetical protein